MSSEFFKQSVHRVMESAMQGTYAQIATGIATSDDIDRSCIGNTTYTCVVMSVDLSANESDFGNAASAIPTWLPVFKQNTGPDGILSMEAESYVHNIPRGDHEWTYVAIPRGVSVGAAMNATPDLGVSHNAASK